VKFVKLYGDKKSMRGQNVINITGVNFPKEYLGFYLHKPNRHVGQQIQIRQKLNSFPVTREVEGGMERAEADIFRIFSPDLYTLEQQMELWNSRWKYGIPKQGPGVQILEQDLLVNIDNITHMHWNSWSNILMAFMGPDIVSAIWGVPRDFEIEAIRNYALTTHFKTFEDCSPLGNSRFCVSVVLAREYGGYITEEEGINIAQANVLESLIDTVCHPYQTDVFAYSRPSSLSSFVKLIWGLRKAYGYKVQFDENLGWIAEHNGEIEKVEITSKGILLGGRLCTSKDGEINFAEVSIDEQGNYFIDGVQLKMDDVGVYIVENGQKDYLVKIDPYLETDYDLMKRFHGERGGELVSVFPESRRDLVSLDYNTLYHFFIGHILSEMGLFAEIFSRFNRSQKRVVTEAIVSPQLLKRVLKRNTASPKDLFSGAFSREKSEVLIAYVKHSNNQKVLLEKLKGKA
jgi:hypothetical protein